MNEYFGDHEWNIYVDEDQYICTRCGRRNHSKYMCYAKKDIFGIKIKTIYKRKVQKVIKNQI
tara:strand:- start:1256 stop:1441 length:186 start_codon:yes stop_codon:yes gene_type:complete